MRVLHVLQSNRMSGAENVVGDICMMLGDEFEMAYCSPEGPIRKSLEDRNVTYKAMRNFNYSELSRIIKEYKPDLIHAHDVKATVLSVLCSPNTLPIISHLHGNMEDMRKVGIKSFLYMLSTKKTKKVITVSEGCLDDYAYKGKIHQKTIFLQNIIYRERINNLITKDKEEYNFDFVYVGRLSYPKDPERIAEVAARVLIRCKDAHFGVIGDGDYKNKMEFVFKKYNVEKRVTFTGVLEYPYKALERSKCLLMCSRFEGTPIAALEALVLGVPIVSTPADGMKNLVENGITGYLSEEDEVLIEKVVDLITSTKKQKELSENCKEKVKKIMSEEKYKNTLVKIYKDVSVK